MLPLLSEFSITSSTKTKKYEAELPLKTFSLLAL